ncbi:MAG TPA: hypothetical protein VIL36_17195 [Acidimicrobiales bacterium]
MSERDEQRHVATGDVAAAPTSHDRAGRHRPGDPTTRADDEERAVRGDVPGDGPERDGDEDGDRDSEALQAVVEFIDDLVEDDDLRGDDVTPRDAVAKVSPEAPHA